MFFSPPVSKKILVHPKFGAGRFEIHLPCTEAPTCTVGALIDSEEHVGMIKSNSMKQLLAVLAVYLQCEIARGIQAL